MHPEESATCHSRAMPARESSVDRGATRARSIVHELGREIREARLDRGLTQAAVARAARMSGPQVSRIERGMARSVSIDQLARLLAVVGLELSARAYPTGAPLRDAAHVALLSRLRGRVDRSLRWRTEVPLPMPGDGRAWDAVIRGVGWAVGVEAETRPRDAQAVIRRISLKQRDSDLDHVLFVVADTRQGRAFVNAAGADLMARFPMDGPRTLHRLGAGLAPEGDALVLL